MKRFLPLLSALVVLVSLTSSMNAQGIVTIGNNSAAYDYPEYFPFNYYWWSTISEAVYTESDILGGGWTGGPGKIESLAWNVTVANPWSNGIVTIMMMNTTATSHPGGPHTPDNLFTVVWQGPAPLFTTLGWNEFTLTNPFNYTGGGVHIKIIKDGTAYSYPYTTFAKSYTTNYTFAADYSDVPAATLVGWNYLSQYSFRPDLQMRICNGPKSEISMDIPAFVNIPGSIPVNYAGGRPEGDFTITVTVRLMDLQNNVVVEMPAEYIPISGEGQTYGSGIVNIPTGAVPPGYYIVSVIFNTMDQCNGMGDEELTSSLLVLPAGAQPCVVYPGDVTNDGLCNYGDIKGLNNYIHDANLQSSWLRGPARYRADAATNPLTYIEWTPQAAVPWQTPNGCYMDTDGNGTVNNFDYIAIKMNWMRDKNADVKKDNGSFSVSSFELGQNFPNPFNPETSINYTLPENSSVKLRVYNSAGELVRELVNESSQAAGIHSVKFGGNDLATGTYIAVVEMTGKSGATYSKSIKMSLTK